MKALTVRQPWALAIILDGKDVENRSRPTKYRGQLYIHAGKDWADEGANTVFRIAGVHYSIGSLIQGMVIGTVDVIDCHHANECKDWAETGSACSEWALADQWHWVLSNPRPLATPFPEKGKLGLWNLAELP